MRLLPVPALLATLVAAGDAVRGQCPDFAIPLPGPAGAVNHAGAVAVEGGWIAVGSRDAERVDVYRAGHASYEHAARLAPNPGTEGTQFGWDVDVEGPRIFVAAPGQGDGTVYVFQHTGGTWNFEGQIEPRTPRTGDPLGFGHAVSADGDRLAVGVLDAGVGGAVELWIRNGSGWRSEQVLYAAGLHAARFGESLALDGDLLAVGAHGTCREFCSEGDAFLYARGPAGWELMQRFRSPDGPRPGRFGTSVGLRDGVLAVGEPFETEPGIARTGVVHVFAAPDWRPVARLAADLPGMELPWGRFDGFGTRVVVDGGRVLVGSPWTEVPGPGRGAAFLFDRDPSGSWALRRRLTVPAAPEDEYDAARTVALGGEMLAFPSVVWGAGVEEGDLWVFDARGDGGVETVCPGGVSSTGGRARLDWRGSLALSQDRVRLLAERLPAGTPAMLLYGPTTASQPFGAGVLCVGSPHFRLGVEQASKKGRAKWAVDLSAPPAGSGPGRLGAGSEWVFQAVYRDGATLNTSSALRITFCP